MSDYKKPRTNLNDFLPFQLQSPFLKNLNENLFNRFLTKDEYQHIVGIIGNPDPTSPLKQIPESTVYRQAEQLQPVVSATVGSETMYLTFQDYLQRLSRLGVDTNDFAEWGRTLQFNYVPPIDIDKLINYQDYYWDSADINDVPDYITIKNQQNWALARSNEFKKTITKINTPYNITIVDEYNITVTGNVLQNFAIGDYVLIAAPGNVYLINEIKNISLNPTTGKTQILLLDNLDDTAYTQIYNFNIAIKSINPDNSFTVVGDMSSVFTPGYVFLTLKDATNTSYLWNTTNSTFDTSTNTTKVFVEQTIPVNATWTVISLMPMASLADAEYNAISGNSIVNYNTQWDNIFLGGLIWYRNLQLITSTSGYSYLGDHGIYDNSFNFVNQQIRPGDVLQLQNGPSAGTYQIISVQNNFLGIDSSVRMFTKNNLDYVINRPTIYDYLISETAPTFPVMFQLWVNPTDDTLNQWNGFAWTTVVHNISLLVNAAHQRYKLSLTQDDPWSQSNKWIHKNELTSFSGKSRAQLPIIEFDPFLELSSTSLMTYQWKYRSLSTNLYSDTTAQPLLFEIADLRIKDSANPDWIFINSNTIMVDQQYGNMANDIKVGSRIRISGTHSNDGLYYVSATAFKQQSPTSTFRTYITLTENAPNPFDLPVGGSIGPEFTSQGDAWLGFDKHWIFYGVRDVLASSINPTENPMLDIFVKAYTDNVNGYETNVGLNWQSFSYFNDGNKGVTIRFDDSLHQYVLYDDYQEGDIRIYINGVRQYGNFTDIRSNINSDYVGSISFDTTVTINKNDLLRIELGEYALEDIGRRAVSLVTTENLVDPTLPYELVNITRYRKLEQDKGDKNVYPFFTVYDIHGNPEEIASRIFTYREDQSYPVNNYILKRIVNDTSTNDYGFVQELSDPTTGELYSYKNFSQPNYPLQTIWKRGLNNEQFVPAQLSDGEWDIPNPWFYNINHELRSNINLSECLKHFTSIIAMQKVPGVVNSSNINQIYLSDNINYGLGGTIKEHNNGFDLSVSSVFVNNVNPLQLIQFGHDQYLNGYNLLQEEYIKNINSFLLNNKTLSNMSAVQSLINDNLTDLFEKNDKFDEWFGDSTTWDETTQTGVKNWIATLPFFGLVKKKVPYALYDSTLGVNAIACHDGHIQDVALPPSVVQMFLNNLVSSGVVQQNIVSDTTPFPTSNIGTLVIRMNTTAKTRILYRFSAASTWEVVDYQKMLSNMFLTIEQSLYDVCPTYDTLVYDYTENATDSHYIDYNETQFSKWAAYSGIRTPLLNTGFKNSDPFTWNYEFTPIQHHPVTGTISYNTAASYQALYTKIYNTPYPNLEPWKMQGYSDKPAWWDATYADDSGTRLWKSSMWNNIFNGTVPAGQLLPNGNTSSGVIGQISPLFSYIPVNTGSTATEDGYQPDDLLPPYWNSANGHNSRIKTPYDANLDQVITTPNIDYTFGDGNPNEWEWKTSAQYLYDQMIVSFRIDPINFTYKTFNGSKTEKINCLDVDDTTKKVFSHKDTIFHGDMDSDGNVFLSNGFNQWYIQYNRYYGYDGEASQFKSLWKNWDTNLSYLFASYIDTASLNVNNQVFDITNKDYNVGPKKTYGFKDMWFDTLLSTVLSVPSKYSPTRSLGTGWTVQMNSLSPTSNDISYYPKENFAFKVQQNSGVFEVSAYDLVDAGINEPTTYVNLNYSETLELGDLTNYTDSNQYSATITIGSQQVMIVLHQGIAPTVNAALNIINQTLGNLGSIYINNGNLSLASSNGQNISILDSGLFSTLHSGFTGISAVINSGFTFQKYFDINGNVTNVFVEGSTFTVANSTQFNGTYSIKSIYYDITNGITRIFVNEDVTLTSDTVDGTSYPANRRTLPDTWVSGTEVYLSTDVALPAPFDEFTPYYVIRLSDYTFSLAINQAAAQAGTGAIVAVTVPSTLPYVGRIQYTFKALGGQSVNTAWRKHYSDTREVITAAQPMYISGIQQIVDFMDGYSDYLESIGFDTTATDFDNTDPATGRLNGWQLEIEYFINWLYVLTSLRQQQDLEYQITVDLANSRFLYTNNNVNIASTQANVAQRVILMSTDTSALPEPFNNPLKQFVPYYIIQSNDGKGFQVAYTNADAQAGNFIPFGAPGNGTIFFKVYRPQNTYPQWLANPYKKFMRINHPQGILSDVVGNDRNDILTNQKIYDQYGNLLTHDKLVVLRNDEYSQIYLTDVMVRANTISQYPIYISGIHSFIDSYEHILSFNDYSVSGNLIYDTYLGLRTPRFYVEFNRSPNMTLRPNVGGFILYNDDLMQNFESAVNDLRYMYDTYTVQESKELTKQVRKSLGYGGPNNYMTDINVNAKSDFIFWRGMIQNKGTNLSINAYTNQTLFNDATLDEFWTYKLARFGDAKEQNYIEMKLKRSDSVRAEFRAEFVNPDEPALDDTFTAIALSDNTRWWDQPDVLDKMAPNLSFMFNARIPKIINVEPADIQYIRGEFVLPLNGIYDGVIISYKNLSTGNTVTMINGADYQMVNSQVVQFNSNPTSLVNLQVSCLTYNYNAQNPSVFVDKTAGVIVNQIAMWNPALGQHDQYAYSLVDLKLPNDPAVYSVDFTGNIYDYVWYKNKVATVWMDQSKIDYLPYFDAGVYPSINDRIYNWGKMSDIGQLNLYRWTESTVPPSGYTLEYPNSGTPKQNLYANEGSLTNPNWNLVDDLKFSTIAVLVDSTTDVPFVNEVGGAVNVYRNGKFDITMDLTQYDLVQYVTGPLLPGQTSLPNPQDYITVVLPKPVPTAEQITNMVYKYDTPYSTTYVVNNNDGSQIPYYYFWVQNSQEVVYNTTNYQSTVFQAQKDLITNPNPYSIITGLRYQDDGYGVIFGNVFDGVPYDLPVRYTQLVVRGLKGMVTDDERYALRFIRDFTLRDKMPVNGDIYDYSATNPVKSPLALKNVHYEWKMFRQKQTQKIDKYLWEKLISALVGYNVKDEIIDTSTTIPSLDRILFDTIYGTDTQYGLGNEQVFTTAALSIPTIQSILTDPNQNFVNIDINSFLSTHNFNTVNDIVTTMYDIYDNFDASNINYIYFATLHDAMSLKLNSSDIFKTSWVALDISQNVNVNNSNDNTVPDNIHPGGACDIDENIVVPTLPPLPSPSPTPSVTPTLSITPSVTASISASVTPTQTPTVTPTLTTTPTITTTPTVTPSVTGTPGATVTPTMTPTVTATSTVTPTVTPTTTATPTPTLTPSPSFVPITACDTAILNSNPLVYYKLDDLGTNVAKDSSLNNNDAFYYGNVTLGEPGLYPSSVRSVFFNNDFSQGNYILGNYGSFLDLANDFTVEMFTNAKASDQHAALPALVYVPYNASTQQPQFMLYIDTTTNKFAFRIATTDQPFVEVQSNVTADGSTYMITCKRQGNTLHMFINAQEVASAPCSGTNLFSQTYGLAIGGAPYQIPSVNNFVGGIDNFSLYGTALDDADIFAHYTCWTGVGITPSPTPTPSVTPTLTSTVTPTITRTITPTVTITPTMTATVTPTATLTPSVTKTITPTATAAPTQTPAPTTTPTATTTPPVTITPSASSVPTLFLAGPPSTQTANCSGLPTQSCAPTTSNTLSASGGVPPYTYGYNFISGSPELNTFGPFGTSQSGAITISWTGPNEAIGTGGHSYVNTFQYYVTDSVGQTTFLGNNVTVTWNYNDTT